MLSPIETLVVGLSCFGERTRAASERRKPSSQLSSRVRVCTPHSLWLGRPSPLKVKETVSKVGACRALR